MFARSKSHVVCAHKLFSDIPKEQPILAAQKYQ